MKPLSHPPTDADHVLGRLDAPLVVVEYGDYDCPHTRRAHGHLLQLLEERDMALVFRHFPLRHLHQNAEQLSEAMEAITEPALYWAAHQRLMAQRRMSLEVASAELRELGLELKQLAAGRIQAALRVQRDVDRGLVDGVHSTPSFFFNGTPHDGHYDLDTLRQQIAQVLAGDGA
ncbi:MAG TPA: thioredoxin domain-containing protein [Polyangiaceae bacterium]